MERDHQPFQRKSLDGFQNGFHERRLIEGKQLMAVKSIDRKFGYLRETSEAAKKAGHDPLTGLNRTGLDEYLAVIFPGKIFIHNQAFGGDDKRLSRHRPDYRNDELKLIIEFDGLPHYQRPQKIVDDEATTKLYQEAGYKVVRIPFFIQLTNKAVVELFGIHVQEDLFDGSFPSLNEYCSPANLCPLGVERMAKEFLRFPDQYATNLNSLKSWPKEDWYKNGYEFLEREYNRLQKENASQRH